MATEVRKELHQINNLLLQAKTSIGVFAIDENEEHWESRGPLFLNEVAEWNIEQLNKKIENQILNNA